ncbi:MAG: carboxypeptidase-like regulatory domain-containing protein [Thermoplasmata archaeon]|nr:carboxypeptidase-like regulatory domain-containing protein [Thermoplasmata archaeon]
MAGTTVAVRCPVCGADLRVSLAAQPPTQWFPCPQCHSPVPVVVPRDPPPLYSWEVLQGLYPPLTRPRVPKWRARRAVAAALIVVTVLAAGLAAVLVYEGYDASRPSSFTVDGTVDHQVGGIPQPLDGAKVVLTNDGNHASEVFTVLDGTFAFSNVPPGGVTLNVTAAGFAPLTVTTFVSVVYLTQATGLQIVLSPGGPDNSSTVALAPFPDLEQFLASVGSGAVLLGIIALVAGFAAVATFRDDRPAIGVVGGAAGLVAPLVLFYLSLSAVFPLLEGLSAILAAAGSFTLALRAIQLAQTGPAPDFD